MCLWWEVQNKSQAVLVLTFGWFPFSPKWNLPRGAVVPVPHALFLNVVASKPNLVKSMACHLVQNVIFDSGIVHRGQVTSLRLTEVLRSCPALGVVAWAQVVAVAVVFYPAIFASWKEVGRARNLSSCFRFLFVEHEIYDTCCIHIHSPWPTALFLPISTTLHVTFSLVHNGIFWWRSIGTKALGSILDSCVGVPINLASSYTFSGGILPSQFHLYWQQPLVVVFNALPMPSSACKHWMNEGVNSWISMIMTYTHENWPWFEPKTMPLWVANIQRNLIIIIT